MTPFVADADFTLYVGDVREVLAALPDGSVDCCVTSPPYWGLRDYGTGQWHGGDSDCDHLGPPKASDRSGLKKDGRPLERTGQNEYERGATVPFRSVCGKCGATRTDRQIGLEQSPGEYVAQMVAVFREVRRVLSDAGTLWLNLGDSYAMSTKGAGGDGKQHTNAGSVLADRSHAIPIGLKPKDLVGIPWRVAFALQADGWYLRSDIIWAKPNPMPESVTDRPTKAHEYVFLLSKSARYFFDADAVREDADPDSFRSERGPGTGAAKHAALGKMAGATPIGRTCGVHESGRRNIRSVWTIGTQPYAEAHFATFPEALPERCIKAGCPEGGTVLDPFMGSGTTALVARRLGRNSIGVELNPDYVALAARRLQQLSLLAEALHDPDIDAGHRRERSRIARP